MWIRRNLPRKEYTYKMLGLDGLRPKRTWCISLKDNYEITIASSGLEITINFTRNRYWKTGRNSNKWTIQVTWIASRISFRTTYHSNYQTLARSWMWMYLNPHSLFFIQVSNCIRTLIIFVIKLKLLFINFFNSIQVLHCL